MILHTAPSAYKVLYWQAISIRQIDLKGAIPLIRLSAS